MKPVMIRVDDLVDSGYLDLDQWVDEDETNFVTAPEILAIRATRAIIGAKRSQLTYLMSGEGVSMSAPEFFAYLTDENLVPPYRARPESRDDSSRVVSCHLSPESPEFPRVYAFCVIGSCPQNNRLQMIVSYRNEGVDSTHTIYLRPSSRSDMTREDAMAVVATIVALAGLENFANPDGIEYVEWLREQVVRVADVLRASPVQ